MKHLKPLSALALAFVLLVALSPSAGAQTAVTLSGQITNGRGEPLAGLRLTLEAGAYYQAITDADGRYTFSVPAGNCMLHIGYPQSYDRSVHAPPVYRLETSRFYVFQNTNLDLQLPFKKLSVHVQDSQGTAVANVLMGADGAYPHNIAIGSLPSGTVFASGNSYYAGAINGTVTDANGDLDLWLLPTSTDPSPCYEWGCGYYIMAQPPAGSQLALEELSDVAVTQDSSLTITLQPGVSLTGQVTDGQGNPVSGLMVYLRGYGGIPSGLAITDANGRYGFSVRADWYYLKVTNNWDLSKPYDAWNFDLRSDPFEITQNMTLDLAPFKGVMVHVVDGYGQPVAGTGLAASGGSSAPMIIGGVSFSGSSFYWYDPSMYVNSVVTDASGNATLSLLPGGATFTAYPPAGTGLPSKSLFVDVTNVPSVTIRLSTWVILSGRITDAEGNGLPNQSVDLAGTVSTDSNGYYALPRDPGYYFMGIIGGVPVGSPLHAAQSYNLRTRDGMSLTQDTTLDITLPFKPVNVHVLDANDQPVAGVLLGAQVVWADDLTFGGMWFYSSSSYSYDTSTGAGLKTDANGNATLWLLPASDPGWGGYSITAAAPLETGLPDAYLYPVVVLGETNVTVRFAGALPTKPPVLASISPFSMGAGDPSFTLVVNGTDFYKSSVVRWNGADRSTTYVSNTQLTAVIPSTDVALPGTAYVTVWTPAPGGGESSALPFTIFTPLPSATINVYAAMHTTGTGATSGDQKSPLALNLKIFDRATFPSSELKDYASVWNSGPGLISPWARITGPTVTTFSNGPANLYTVRVPATSSANNMTSGRYLVVGKVEGAEVYVGAATDPLAVDSVTNEYFQVVQKSDGQIVPAVATSVPGKVLPITPTPSATATPPATATQRPKPKPTSKVVPTSPTPKPTATPKPTVTPKKVPSVPPNAVPTQTLVPATPTPKKALTATPMAAWTLPPTKTPHLTPTPRDKPTKR